MYKVIVLLSLMLLVFDLKTVLCICDVPLKFYKDLNCIPIYDKKIKSDCPVEYDCSHIHSSKAVIKRRNNCYFNDNWYFANEWIEVPSVCGISSCQCTRSLNFECTTRECPYLELPNPNQCYLAYELNNCCPNKFNCFAQWKSLTACNVKGTIYLEGELFPSPLDKCDLCVCSKDFDRSYGSHVCESVPCKMQILKSGDMMRFCAPVYLSPDDCCPVDIRCLTDSDRDALYGPPVDEKYPYCIYEDIKMEIGERVTHTEEQFGSITFTKCTCLIPPYVTCYRFYE